MTPNIVGAIFARGGSKGVPRKNVRPLAGKPLIGYSIEVARACRHIQRVVVSTDDAEIASVAREFKAEVPFMRPAELATDRASEWLAWQHAIRTLEEPAGAPKVDVMVSVPTTAPLRSVEDVDRCIEALLESDADIVITVKAAERSPYFNMVSLDERGFARLMMHSSEAIHNRQTAPKAFDITTVAYACRTSFIMNAKGIFDGKVRAVEVPRERALDIDTEDDFLFAEFMMERKAGRKG